MANTYKNIVITPNRDTTANIVPQIVFSGGDTTSNTDVTLRVYTASNGTLSFEGSAGQLFSVTNDLTGSIFSVNDVSGIPSIDVYANGNILLAPFSGQLYLGLSANLNFDFLQATKIVNPTLNSISFHTAQSERARITPTGNVLIGRDVDSNAGQAVKLDINGAVNASAYIVGGGPIGLTLLGNIATTSGATQTLSSLNLTNYENLILSWDNVRRTQTASLSFNDGTADFTISEGYASGGNASFFQGTTQINLRNGSFISYGQTSSNTSTWSISNVDVNSTSVSSAVKFRTGRTRIGTTTTSISVKTSGTFLEGYVTVWGQG